jgi:hypothetical protein
VEARRATLDGRWLIGVIEKAGREARVSEDCRRAFIIGLDGAMGSAVRSAATPRLDALLDTGVVTYAARTTVPPASFEAWGAMFHGVGPEKHRINDGRLVPDDTPWPSFMKVANDARPEMRCASFVGWHPINSHIIESCCQCDRVSMLDADLSLAAAEYIKTYRPHLFFMQLDSIDLAGHHHVYGSQKYLEQITIVDGYLGTVVDAIRDAGMLGESLVIVLSDHGGQGTHHDGDIPDCTTIFWGCRWPGAPGRVELGVGRVNIADTAAVVARALRLPAPVGWDGKVPDGVLD